MKKAVIYIILSLIGIPEALVSKESIDWEKFLLHVNIAYWIYTGELNGQKTSKEMKEKEKQKYLKCAATGNSRCSFILGEIYYNEGEYFEAYRHFMDVSQKYNGPADYRLGDMCLHGKGTEVDYDKAIFHYKKAIDSTLKIEMRRGAAHNISAAYQTKHQDDKPKIVQRDSPEMKESRMSIAWLYVEHWMGQQTVQLKGTILTPTKNKRLIDFLANIERSNDPLTVSEIKNQAFEICSGIEGCKR